METVKRAGVVAAFAVAGSAALAACSSATPGQAPASATATATNAHTATLAADGRTGATLDVLSGTTALTVGMADFGPGGSLLKVVTPAGAQPPVLTAAHPDGASGPELVQLTAANAAAVTITLNAAVTWKLELDGGATRTDLDLRAGQVSGIAFDAGSSLISVALPRPHGSVPVRMAGGASDFQLSLPAGVPARVTAGGGASEVSLEGQQHTGVAGGSVFTTTGWAPGATGFDIDATAGASQITILTRSGT